MPCANKIDAACTLSSPLPIGWKRPFFIAAIAAMVDAFQEALQLRRAAHRAHPLDDQ